MATTLENPSDQSMVSLVSGIVDDVHDLITQQVKLTRTEIQDDLRKAGGIALMFAAGAGVSLLGAVLACLMLVFLLHWLTAPAGADAASLPLWACFGIVGAAFGVLGAALLSAGKSKYESTHLLPDKAAHELKETVECLTNKK
jgi:uncharacterized membrane protein YqjE